MTTPISVINKVSAGDKMGCFQLLADGIESGWLPQVQAHESTDLSANIPRIIAQYWHSRDLPPEVAIAVQTMREHNPGYEHYLANDETAWSFINQHHGAEGTRLFDACFHPAMRADFWRICWLYERGGIYVDVDTRAHAPLAHIAAGADFRCLLTYSIGQPWCIDNDFIMVERRNPVILAILVSMFANVARFLRTGQFENIWVETGPGVTTMAVSRWLAQRWVAQGQGPETSGIVFRHHNAVAEAFNGVEMDYKATAEGNWRLVNI